MFILCYCFTILTESSPYYAQWPEIYMTIYILTLICDKLREVASIDSSGVTSRILIHFHDIWNLIDAFACLLFCIGFPLRWIPETFVYGRSVWIAAIVFFLIHMFDIFQANNGLATYIMILQKMGTVMSTFIVILGCVVGSYGIVLQATRFPFRKPDWAILKDIWVEPYFNLYGEVYHEYIDTDICIDDPYSIDDEHPPCWCCSWIGPLFQSGYLIIANILMLNLLVAVFNSVYEKVNQVSQALIRFQRYRFIVDYQLMPTIPPPFIFVVHIYMVIRAIIRKYQGRSLIVRDPGLLKVVMVDEDLEQLHDFEAQARDELWEQTDLFQKKATPEEHMRNAAERIEAMQIAVEQLAQTQEMVIKMMKDHEKRHSHDSDAQNPGSVPRSKSLREGKRPPLVQTQVSVEQKAAEESTSRALGPGLYRRLRVVSLSETSDPEVSQAARFLMIHHDTGGVSDCEGDATPMRRNSPPELQMPAQNKASTKTDGEKKTMPRPPSIIVENVSDVERPPPPTIVVEDTDETTYSEDF